MKILMMCTLMYVPIFVTREGLRSKSFSNTTIQELEELSSNGTILFNHTQPTLDRHRELKESLKLTSLGYDQNGKQYAASYESKE